MQQDSSDTSRCLERVRAGQANALANLFDRHRGRLRRVVSLRLVGALTARVDASDVLQEAYLDATQRIDNFLNQGRVSVFVWLRGIALDRLAKLQRHHVGTQRRALTREVSLPDESSELLARQLVDGQPTPLRAMLGKELRERVKQAIQGLRDDDQEVIVMRHFEGLSNHEVAEALSLSDSAATMRHGRALLRLKELLHKGDTESD